MSAPKTMGYREPGDRVVPPVRMDGPLSFGIPPSTDDSYRPCPVCRHVAWREAPGSPMFVCACPPGPRGCHYPSALRFSTFPGVLPPEPEAA